MLTSLLPFAIPLALIFHGIATFVHAYITRKTGADHAVVFDKVVDVLDKVAQAQADAQANAQRNSSITSSGA